VSDEVQDWRDWIGRTRTATEVLEVEPARRMQATLGRAMTLGAGDPLPPAWHWLYFHDVAGAGDLGRDGHPRLGVFMPPVPLTRRMWAGGTLGFHAPLALGQRTERTSTFTAIEEKHGRSGSLIFVTVDHELRQAGRLCVSERQDIVYRELPDLRAGLVAVTPEPAPIDATISDGWTMDSTALFRYSALTFNGHRIHYDAEYCRQVEGYPDLVVHGPLIATLLLDLAHRHGRPLGRFDYRAKSPLFVGGSFTVHGRPDGDGTELWATGAHGGLAMQATLCDTV
jgi:3-methylfumaryl-CoA hydratase